MCIIKCVHDIIVSQNSKVNKYNNKYHIYNCHTELYFSQLSYISDILRDNALKDCPHETLSRNKRVRTKNLTIVHPTTVNVTNKDLIAPLLKQDDNSNRSRSEENILQKERSRSESKRPLFFKQKRKITH